MGDEAKPTQSDIHLFIYVSDNPIAGEDAHTMANLADAAMDRWPESMTGSFHFITHSPDEVRSALAYIMTMCEGEVAANLAEWLTP